MLPSQGCKPKKQHPKRGKSKQPKFVTHQEMTGYKFNPGSNVPAMIQNPWYPVKIAKILGKNSSYTIKINDLLTYFMDQLDSNRWVFRTLNEKGISAKPFLAFKFHSLRAWNITGKSIAISIFDVTRDADATKVGLQNFVLTELMDSKSADVPCLGYRYPEALRVMPVFTNENKDRGVCCLLAPSDSDVLIIFDILWQPATTQKAILPNLEVSSILRTHSDGPSSSCEPSALFEDSVLNTKSRLQLALQNIEDERLLTRLCQALECSSLEGSEA